MARGPNAGEVPALSSADEGFSCEKGNDRHGVLGEAEVEILFVAEALEAPGGAVLAEELSGVREVQVHNTVRPLVELDAPILVGSEV